MRGTKLAVRRALAAGTAAAVATAGLLALAPSASAEEIGRPPDGILRVKGHGYGHGHGMSQWGAHGAASKGKTYQEILAFYYPKTSLGSQSNLGLTVRVTSDTDGTTEVLQQPGLARSSGSGSPVAMPSVGATRWRTRTAVVSGTTTTILEYLKSGASTWTRYGDPSAATITFSNPSTGKVRLRLADSKGAYYREYIGSVRGVRYNGVHYSVVATVMETYLRGVVPAEMPALWEYQALRTQAVAARTYATFERAASPSGRPYQTCDSTACQVFHGYADYTATGALRSAGTHSRTDDAVTATAGRIVTYGGKAAFTQFSASNGGYMVAGSQPYLVAKADPYDGVYASTAHSWTDSVDVRTLEAKHPSIGRLSTLKVERDGLGEWGGRTEYVTLVGSKGSLRLTGTTFAGEAGFKHRWWTLQVAQPVPRLAGSDRYATAARVALDGGAFDQPEVVYVVSGLEFADALGGAALAGGSGSPVLLTEPTSLPKATADALSVLRPAKIIVIGGPVMVSTAVQAALKPFASTGVVERLSGSDRYATAAALWTSTPTGGVVYLTNGEEFPDGLTGAAAAASSRSAVLLTKASSLPAATAQALDSLKPSEIVVLGGTTSVSASVEKSLAAYAPTVTRVGGYDRFATAAKVAARIPGATRVYVANGYHFPDALAGAALAGTRGAPVLLTAATTLPDPTRNALTTLKPQSITVLGGTAMVSSAVASTLAMYVSP